jgi:hypothetical protein
MSWTPDDDFVLTARRIITRAREEAILARRDWLNQEVEKLTARGIRGGAVLSAAETSASRAFSEWGHRALTELLGLFTSVYGQVPANTVPWIRATLTETFDGFINGMTRELEDRRKNQGVETRGVREELARVAAGLKRDMEIQLAPIELRARLGAIASGELPSEAQGTRDIDAFISYASDDRTDVATPLAEALTKRGFKVWFDQYELKVGMSVYGAIDNGLRRSRFGVVVLSPSFFAKEWPLRELHALAALAASETKDKVLPVWHRLGHSEIAQYSPLLADVYAARMNDGVEAVAEQIAAVLR